METQPLVSVIVNCYNGEAFLRRAIDSVIAQTWSNWEIVFWDNQSSDASASIVNSYEDIRIFYYYAPKHTLLYEARNSAYEKTRGDFLAFLDVDDWWLPEKLEQQMILLRDPEVAAVYGNYWVEHRNTGTRRISASNMLPEGYILDELLKSYNVGMLTLIIRRSALPLNSPPFDSRYNIIGDFDLVIRIAAKYKIACVQNPIAVYEIHGNNMSIRRRSQQITELENWCREMDHVSEIGRSKSYCKVRENVVYMKGIDALLAGNLLEAIAQLTQLSWGRLKLRLLLGFFIPRAIISRLKGV